MDASISSPAPAPDIVRGSVLLVEDDAAMAEMVALTLTAAGLDVVTVGDGAAALARFDDGSPPDVVILDLGLPDIDGLDVCREVRERSGLPIIVVTARASSRDVVVGLEAGADDYVTKPVAVPELLARVRASLRRTARVSDEIHVVGDLCIDPEAFTVTRAGDPVHLSSTEFRLLLELVRRRGRACTREELLRSVWGYHHLGDSRLIDMAVKRLRDRVESDPSDPVHVVTVRGVGYRLEDP